MAEGTRSNKAIWLVGSPSPCFSSSKLPSKGEVLRYLFFLHVECKKSLAQSVQDTATAVKSLWDNEMIPTKYHPGIVVHVIKLHNSWTQLKKSVNRLTDTNLAKQQDLKEDLENLFDIAHESALNLIKIPEDREFLLAQREKGRRGQIGMLDKKLAAREKRKATRIAQETKRRVRADGEKAGLSATATLDQVDLESSSFSSSSAESDEDMTSTGTATDTTTPKERIRGSLKLDPNVVAALDRSQTSDRNAARILIPFAKQLGQNPEDLALSASSIRAARLQFREERAAEQKKEFHPAVPLVLHWDGKLMEDLTGKEVVDRLPILVSREGVVKLIFVPKLANSQAVTTAAVIYDTIQDWDIADRIKGFSFDTTAVNTGRVGGVCVLLEQQPDGRRVIQLACRHHVFELVLEAVYSTATNETSNSPNIEFFLSFQQFWSNIVQSEFRTVPMDCAPWAQQAIDRAQDLLRMEHSPRDDYRELLELVVAFLGGVPHGRTPVQFMAPGPVHRALWMARAIYAFKIWMFWDQFQVTVSQRPPSSRTQPRAELLCTGLLTVCLFVAEKYCFAWFAATNACHFTASRPRSSSILGAAFNHCSCHGSNLEKLPETPVVSF
jgi:hypothetical protein